MAQDRSGQAYQLVIDGQSYPGDDPQWEQLYQQDPSVPRSAPWRFLRTDGEPRPAELLLDLNGELRRVRQMRYRMYDHTLTLETDPA